ncbi:MAG: hypothetical protein AAFV95_07650 [Bacteroidota bacterium]
MKKTISLSAFLLLAVWASAQISFNAAYASLNASEWEKVAGDLYPQNGYKLGLDYWFKLKKKRIEFTPEITLASFSQSSSQGSIDRELQARFIGFHFNTSVYPMDLGNDCNCPTFKKDGSIIEKGFFIQVSPGLDVFRGRYTDSVQDADIDAEDTVFNLGLGVGLDIGLLPIVTLTPFASYRYYFETNWEGLGSQLSTTDPSPNDIADNPNQFYIGLKLGFRFDELRNYGWRR